MNNRHPLLAAFLLAASLALAGRAAAFSPDRVVIDPSEPLAKATDIEPGKALENGPDLDLGWNDFVDLRLAASSGAGDVTLTYACTDAPGETGPRKLVVPSALVPRDGKPHTLRIDVGTEVWWRGRLQQLSVNGASVESIRVGDAPGDDYEDDPEAAADPEAQAPKAMDSKRFRIVWGRDTSADFTEAQAHGSLRNLEEAWQFYVKVLKMKPPGHRDGKRYRVTITTMRGGYDAGGLRINIHPSGLRVDPPTWVIPHELMHVFQFAQGAHGLGDWYEAHANYGRERWLQYFAEIAGEPTSNLEPGFPTMSHWVLAHGRDYYLCWPLLAYLDENPDGLPGLGQGFVARMWQNSRENEGYYDEIQRLAPKADLKTITGLYARRAVTWDYQNKAAMNKAAGKWGEDIRKFIYLPLRRRADDPTWWQSLPHLSPQQGGYAIHELKPEGSGVTVEFRGLPDKERGADWRVSLVAVKDDLTTRYGPLFSKGKQTIKLAPDETHLYLVVAATPDRFLPGGQDDMAFPYQSHPQRQRFPYEVKISGAAPVVVMPPAPSVPGHRHPNGGGFVAETAQVDATAYVGSNARVLGTAKVLGQARIEDFAEVRDAATVQDAAVVSGYASVRQQAVVKDYARVRDWAEVTGTSVVSGDARVLQHAQTHGNARIQDSATVEGRADASHAEPDTYVGGDAVLSGDYGGGRKVSNGFQFGFLPYQECPQEWIDARKAPGYVYADYEFDKPNDSFAKDWYGVTDGILIGRPKWSESDAGHQGTLTFDGRSVILLERSVSDFRAATITATVKWAGGKPMQPLFHFGTGADKGLFFTPDDGTGHAALVARGAGREWTVAAPTALPKGEWCDVTVTLDGAEASISLSGQPAARGAYPVSPDQFLAPNTVEGLQHNYIGRGADPAQPWFRGALDAFRVSHGAKAGAAQ